MSKHDSETPPSLPKTDDTPPSSGHPPNSSEPRSDQTSKNWGSSKSCKGGSESESTLVKSGNGSRNGNNESLVPLSKFCSSNVTEMSTFRGNIVYGNDSVDITGISLHFRFSEMCFSGRKLK